MNSENEWDGGCRISVEPQRAQRSIGGERFWAEHFRQTALDQPALLVHLKEPVLGMDETQGGVEITCALRPNLVGIPAAFSNDRNRGGEFVRMSVPRVPAKPARNARTSAPTMSNRTTVNTKRLTKTQGFPGADVQDYRLLGSLSEWAGLPYSITPSAIARTPGIRRTLVFAHRRRSPKISRQGLIRAQPRRRWPPTAPRIALRDELQTDWHAEAISSQYASPAHSVK